MSAKGHLPPASLRRLEEGQKSPSNFHPEVITEMLLASTFCYLDSVEELAKIKRFVLELELV